MEIEKKEIKPPVLNYLGRWVNSYDKARAIGEITFFISNGELFIALTGSKAGPCPGEWEAVPVQIYSYAPDTNDVVAFRAQVELGNMHAFLAMNDNKGLLIIAGYFSYKNNEGKSDFFVREFFSKV